MDFYCSKLEKATRFEAQNCMNIKKQRVWGIAYYFFYLYKNAIK